MVGRCSLGRRGAVPRSGWTVAAALLLASIVASPAHATVRYGDIQISGNVQTQELFRIQEHSDTFSAFNPVQQRNTFRLQYEHQLVKDGGNFLQGMAQLPFIRSANLFAYYRFVYDSIYDLAPGPHLEAQDGSHAGKLDQIPRSARHDIAFENVLREFFIDIDLARVPVSLRIGRQQIVWGEALSFRALDSVNGLDLSWHLQQEAGLLGKVGFDELRIPAWTIKALWDIGSVGPVSNSYLEMFDIPFDFQPAYARFEPAPWSIPDRNPFRGGLVIPAGPAFLQACFDDTGNTQPNAAANPDFSNASETGFCPSRDRQRTRIQQGLYGRHDAGDVNQVGGRFGGNAYGVGFTLNYMYRRHLGVDLPGAGAVKAQVGLVNNGLPGQLQIAPHTTLDPITREEHDTIGYVRIPIEWYYPYVHVVGASANYFEEYTSAVWTVEGALTHGMPINTLSPFGNGLKKKDVLLGALNFDRPTWIKWLNRRSTWLIIGQLDFNYIFGHDKIRTGPSPFVQDNGATIALDGDVGLPNSCTIPGQFRSHCDIDELKQFEALTILAATTFYWGGSLAPIGAWISDWGNAPSMAFALGVDYLPSPNVIITPALRIYTNFNRTVDEPWGIGRLSQWDEVQLKLTYQF